MRLPGSMLLPAALLLAAPALTAQAARPTVLVMGTGGTIGSAGDYWGGRAQRVPIADLVRVPGLDSVAIVRSEQHLNVASSAIGPERWIALSRRITELLRADSALAGIVVTHGTDTMEETAWFLDLTVGGERPVVLTGAMRPSNMSGADGPANLTNAVRAVVDVRTRGRGTLVLMNDRLFAAREVTKANSTRVEAFEAPDHGPVAIADPEGLIFSHPARFRGAARFDVSSLSGLPRVDVAYSYAGADSVVIDALVAAGARGIVVAGVGRGGMPPDQSAAVRRAVQRGVVVVVATRAGSGRVPVRMNDGLIGAGELNAQKARVLLSLALTTTSDPAEVRRIFDVQQ